jgi:hypothetical protein
MEFKKGDWADRVAAIMLERGATINEERLSDALRSAKHDGFIEGKKTVGSEYMPTAEAVKQYPLIAKFFGFGEETWGDTVQVRRITGFAMDRAHFIFAPQIENKLAKAAKEQLWENFTFQIRVGRKKKPRAQKAGRK